MEIIFNPSFILRCPCDLGQASHFQASVLSSAEWE